MREPVTENASPVHDIVAEASAALREGAGTTEAWKILENAGLTRLSVPEEAGGDGGGLAGAAELLRAAGYHGLALPVAETIFLAGWALSGGGMTVPDGPLTVAPVRGEEIRLRRDETGWTLYGTAVRVPWVREARRLVVICDSGEGREIALLDTEGPDLSPGENLAGEPRDDLRFDGTPVEAVATAGEGATPDALRLWGALARAISLAGALDRALDSSVEHAALRRQFGRAIGRFQAVQQQLALMAGEVAAADAAVHAAVEAAGAAGVGAARGEIAAAKVSASIAAGAVASAAHQVHGAVGFTERHDLHRATLRLWSYREEFGSETEWAEELGGRIAGGGELWDAVIEPDRLFAERYER